MQFNIVTSWTIYYMNNTLMLEFCFVKMWITFFDIIYTLAYFKSSYIHNIQIKYYETYSKPKKER